MEFVAVPLPPGKCQHNSTSMSTFGNSFGTGLMGMVNLMAMGMHPTFGFPSHIQPMQLSPYAPPHLLYNYPPHYPHPFNDYSSHSPHHHSTSHCLDVASSDGPDIPPSEFPSLEEWFSQLDTDQWNFPQSQNFQQYLDLLANMGINHLDVLYQACKEHPSCQRSHKPRPRHTIWACSRAL